MGVRPRSEDSTTGYARRGILDRREPRRDTRIDRFAVGTTNAVVDSLRATLDFIVPESNRYSVPSFGKKKAKLEERLDLVGFPIQLSH
uniref:Uncharacterized protein n=1 Tax=Vespula pensylvanica TaxID=30213 RepID=A0A834U433_VESPE|nr:hypothetical protein H0235_012105 [Vespula pensylvanica]